MDTSNPAVFCNGELLNVHSGRKIRAVVQVIQSDGGVVTGKSTDEQHLTVHGLPTAPLMNFVEVVGIAEGNKIINGPTLEPHLYQSQTYRAVCQRGHWNSKCVDCEIPHCWRGERSIPYKDVKTSP